MFPKCFDEILQCRIDDLGRWAVFMDRINDPACLCRRSI